MSVDSRPPTPDGERGAPDIVVSTHTFLPVVGGAELGIHEIYKRIGTRRRVTVVTPRLPAALLAEYAADDYVTDRYAVRYTQPPVQKGRLGALRQALDRTFLPFLVAILRIRARHGPVVVNFHFFRSHALAIPILRLMRVPVVLSLVGRSDVLEQMPPLRRFCCEKLARSAGAIAPISAYFTQNESLVEARVIPYGVDTRGFSPERRDAQLWAGLGLDAADTVLICAQRLAPVKRVDALIEALAALHRNRTDVSLVIVGQGSERRALQRLAAGLGLAEKVYFAGYVSSELLPVYFASADIFVFHSMMETFGLVFAQAMASALPIVAANTSCVPFVVAGDNPLVTPLDSEAFANAVNSLIANRNLRASIGVANRRYAEQHFDWDRIAEKYEEVLDRAAGYSARG